MMAERGLRVRRGLEEYGWQEDKEEEEEDEGEGEDEIEVAAAERRRLIPY